MGDNSRLVCRTGAVLATVLLAQPALAANRVKALPRSTLVHNAGTSGAQRPLPGPGNAATRDASVKPAPKSAATKAEYIPRCYDCPR